MAALMNKDWGPWIVVAVGIVTSAVLATWVLSVKISDDHDQETKLIAYYHDLDSKVASDLHDKDTATMSEMNSRYMSALSDLAARMATQEAKAVSLADTESRDYAQASSFEAEMRAGLGTVISQLGSLQATTGKNRSR